MRGAVAILKPSTSYLNYFQQAGMKVLLQYLKNVYGSSDKSLRFSLITMKSTYENLMNNLGMVLVRVLNISSYRLRGLKYRIVKGIVSRATLPPDGNY